MLDICISIINKQYWIGVYGNYGLEGRTNSSFGYIWILTLHTVKRATLYMTELLGVVVWVVACALYHVSFLSIVVSSFFEYSFTDGVQIRLM